MGDISACENSSRFAAEFERDAIEKYRLEVPEGMQGISVEHHLGVDDGTWEVHLYTKIKIRTKGGGHVVRVLRVDDAPSFFSVGLGENDLVENVMSCFNLPKEVAQARLQKVGIFAPHEGGT